MRILITNHILGEWTGTETYVRDLATGLLRRGHQPVVYSRRLGELAEVLRRATIPVVENLKHIALSPDIIHGHHNVTTMTALLHFAATPGVFVCHDRLSSMDKPPIFPRILRYVAVDENCRDRLVLESGIPEDSVRIVNNWVDLERFKPRTQLPPAPRKALIFSRYLGGSQMEILRGACESRGISVEFMGTRESNTHENPEWALGGYDIVFAKARSAMEAMAVGSAVVLVGYDRMGPMVTEGEVERLRQLNFGRRAIDRPISTENVSREISRYDAQDAARVTEWIRREASLEKSLDLWLSIYQDVVREHNGSANDSNEEIRFTSRFLASLDGCIAHLFHTERRLAAMDRELRNVIQSATPMGPLSVEDCKRISLSVENLEKEITAESTITFQVRIKNNSDRALSSLAPNPVHLAMRWMQRNGIPLNSEGERVRLEFPLLPLAEGTYSVTAPGPSERGFYVLRLTLVQEDILWMDSLGCESLWSDSNIWVK